MFFFFVFIIGLLFIGLIASLYQLLSILNFFAIFIYDDRLGIIATEYPLVIFTAE